MNIKCHGRFSGTEEGWMMFENENCEVWEEKANEWKEVVFLQSGKCNYEHKFDGRIATTK